jgi:hypothetical protein
MNDDYPKLSVFRDLHEGDNHWQIWLDTDVSHRDGLCLGSHEDFETARSECRDALIKAIIDLYKLKPNETTEVS